MRRLQLSAAKKLRGIPRRLRSLSRWSHSFAGCYFPRSEYGERYLNWKIPVISSLVNPPSATKKIQSQCMNYMLQAAGLLAASRPQDCQNYYRVACLFILPYLHQSEVTIFYDRDYYLTFFGRKHELAPRQLSTEFGLSIPEGFIERGMLVEIEAGYTEEWWCIGEPI